MPITSNGYVKRTPEEIKKSIISRIESKGLKFRELPADIQNNIIDTAVYSLVEYENLAAETINSYAPGFANAFMWQALAGSLNIDKLSEVKSQVRLEFRAAPNTYIPEGVKVGAFETSQSLTINSTGVGYVIAYSNTDEIAEPNTLTKIDTILPEGISVTNPEASLKRLEAESDEKLKYRAQSILRSPRKGAFDYCRWRLSGVKGVNPQYIQFRRAKRTTQVEVEGTQMLKEFQGIEIVVGGGDDADVAGCIFDSFLETANLFSEPTDGDKKRTINFEINYNGSLIPVVWTRPKLLQLDLEITFAFSTINISVDALQGLLSEKLVLYFNSLQVGAKVNKNAINQLILNILKEDGDIDAALVKTIDYSIKINGLVVNFDVNNEIPEVKFDTYINVKNLGYKLITSVNSDFITETPLLRKVFNSVGDFVTLVYELPTEGALLEVESQGLNSIVPRILYKAKFLMETSDSGEPEYTNIKNDYGLTDVDIAEVRAWAFQYALVSYNVTDKSITEFVITANALESAVKSNSVSNIITFRHNQ